MRVLTIDLDYSEYSLIHDSNRHNTSAIKLMCDSFIDYFKCDSTNLNTTHGLTKLNLNTIYSYNIFQHPYTVRLDWEEWNSNFKSDNVMTKTKDINKSVYNSDCLDSIKIKKEHKVCLIENTGDKLTDIQRTDEKNLLSAFISDKNLEDPKIDNSSYSPSQKSTYLTSYHIERVKYIMKRGLLDKDRRRHKIIITMLKLYLSPELELDVLPNSCYNNSSLLFSFQRNQHCFDFINVEKIHYFIIAQYLTKILTYFPINIPRHSKALNNLISILNNKTNTSVNNNGTMFQLSKGEQHFRTRSYKRIIKTCIDHKKPINKSEGYQVLKDFF